jgi:hypothetical protein
MFFIFSIYSFLIIEAFWLVRFVIIICASTTQELIKIRHFRQEVFIKQIGVILFINSLFIRYIEKPKAELLLSLQVEYSRKAIAEPHQLYH